MSALKDLCLFTFSQKIVSSKTDENVEDQSASVEMVFNPRVSFPINRNNSAHSWLQKQGQFGQKKSTEHLFESLYDKTNFNFSPIHIFITLSVKLTTLNFIFSFLICNKDAMLCISTYHT